MPRRSPWALLLASLTLLAPAAAALPTLERTIAPGAGQFNGPGAGPGGLPRRRAPAGGGAEPTTAAST